MPDENHARFWGPLLIPIGATLCTTIISGAITLTQMSAQRQQTQRAAAAQAGAAHRAEIQEGIANARLAASLYFDKVASLRSKADPTPEDRRRYAVELKLVAALSDRKEVEQLFRQMAETVIVDDLQTSR